MTKLLKLQADFKAGKITKAQYEAAVAELLEEDHLDQAQHDTALEYSPEDGAGDENYIYTQADMDRVVVKKSRQMLRKQLNEAGLVLEGVNSNDLLAKVVELAQAGTNAGKSDTELQQKLTAAEAKAVKFDALNSRMQATTIENAVLKSAGKLNPINPTQVVRALNADYTDLLEYDEETGALLPESVERALKRIAKAEPNLFNVTTEDEEGGKDTGFGGKPPGGAGTPPAKKSDQDAKVAEMLTHMGYGSK